MNGIILLLAATALHAASGPRCADGRRPVFTGEPFRPLYCAGQPASPPSGKPSLAPSEIPAPLTPAFSELDGLAGRWEGMAPFGDERFELLLIVSRAAKGYDVHFEQKDYVLLRRRSFDAELRPTLLRSKGRYAAEVCLQAAPGASRKATVYAGAPGPADPPGFDRKLVVVYRGLAQEHRLLFKAEKDSVPFRYDEVSAERTLSATGELRRSTRASL